MAYCQIFEKTLYTMAFYLSSLINIELDIFQKRMKRIKRKNNNNDDGETLGLARIIEKCVS